MSFPERLLCQLRQTQKAAFAEGTFRNYEVQWSRFTQFCDEYGLQGMPADELTVCLYAQYLANDFASPHSVKNYVNGVRVRHLLGGKSVEPFKSFDLAITFRGISRTKLHSVKQAAPVTVPLLFAMSALVDRSNAEDVVVWAAILIAFFGMLRKSNLVPDSAGSFDDKKQLCRNDVSFSKEGIVLDIKWSKTLQFAQKILPVPILAVPGSLVCPVKAYRNMCKLVRGSGEQPAFMLPNKQPLTYRVFQFRFRQWVHGAGWDAQLFSTHSLRRGGATLAFNAKVPGEMIKLQGDWASDAYLQYCTISMDKRVKLATKVRDAVVKFGGKGSRGQACS